jgi:hypothetical protein
MNHSSEVVGGQILAWFGVAALTVQPYLDLVFTCFALMALIIGNAISITGFLWKLEERREQRRNKDRSPSPRGFRPDPPTSLQ